MKIVFFGTPPFAANLLDKLIEEGVEVSAIVTRPDRPKGRSQKMSPSAVKSLAQEKWPKIPLFQPEKASTEDFADTLKKFDPDLFVVVAYGEIIKTNLLAVPKKTCINVHASLLPKYRGAAPIQRAIMSGEKETGVTIMEMVLKMDAGAMYQVVKTPIPEEMAFGELEEKLCEISGPALLEVLKKIETDTAEKTSQNESEVTFASKITFEDRVIDWSKSAHEIHNQIRGLSPFPGAFCLVEVGGQEKRLLVKKAQVAPSQKGAPGQTLVYEKNRWIVGCGDGAISLLEIQLEGKKNLPVSDFIRGTSVAPKIKIQ